MNVFLTGATGFLGRELVRRISKKHRITCLVRRTSEIRELEKLNLEIVYGDMLKKDSIKIPAKTDAVIHLATSHIPGNEKLNILGTKNLIELCKGKHFIYVSSMAVKRKTLDDYGKTKLKIEELIKKSGLRYIILRPSVIYSKNDLSLIGKSLKIPFIIPIIGNGRYKMNPVYIEDMIKAIEKSLEMKKPGIYDVAGARNIEYNAIIRACKNQFGIKKPVLHLPISLCVLIFRFFPIISVEAIKGISEDTNADISKMVKDMNLKPLDFYEGIKNVNL